MADLFDNKKIPSKDNSYTAKDIEIFEGTEAVRKRPAMYIGGTDEKALHHLVKELRDNAKDEISAAYATEMSISLESNNMVQVSDNGRGIPIDKHPKFPNKSALEVILTTLHSGGKFSQNIYQYSGGLHGVGLSVVNALSERLEITVSRDGKSWKQIYSKGKPITPLEQVNSKHKKGTVILFKPDPEIFGDLSFQAKSLYEMARESAYLYRNAKVKWCNNAITDDISIPKQQIFEYRNGIEDFIKEVVPEDEILLRSVIAGKGANDITQTRVEWVVLWANDNYIQKTYCNTIETILGGSHEVGFKLGVIKALKSYAEKLQIKKFNLVTAEDIFFYCNYILSSFVVEPEFQGQTKEKLVNKEISKEIENLVKNQLELWFSQNHKITQNLLEYILEKYEERMSKKVVKTITRKTILTKNPLPGKLTDNSNTDRVGSELFIVEGDSAAGSARQARNSLTQAILPLRGKVLNVASNSQEKIIANKELKDLELALGCGALHNYSEDKLRYEKIIIMTDADVDGAHIASLLMTFFFIRMPDLVKQGHLYLACPPLYRLTQNNIAYYAHNDIQKEKIISKLSVKKSKIELSRFKGLGEMTPAQLKETTMNPLTRNLIKIRLFETNTANLVNNLMGKNPELRYKFIQEQTLLKIDCLKESLDL